MSGESHSPDFRAVSVLSVVAGVAAANLYYAQPMVPRIAESFGCAASAIGPALVLTQVGYALGMLLLVPLSDARERRSLLVTMAYLTTGTLVAVAASPTPAALAVASLFMGFFTSIPQMAVPFAVGLVPQAQKARAIARVMAGVFVGILLSRSVSGFLSSVFGWRSVYLLAAVLMVLLGACMRFLLPEEHPPVRLRWGAIVRSLGALFADDPILRRHIFIGACGFAAFSVYWSTMAVELASEGLDSRVAALFALAGMAGVLISPVVGRLAPRTGPRPINVAGLLGVIVAFVALYVLRKHPFATIPAVIVLDAGVQASHLANMAVLLTGAGERRSRINAVYMIGYFVGGGTGSFLGSTAWALYGWNGVTAVGVLLGTIGVARVLGGRIGDRAG